LEHAVALFLHLNGLKQSNLRDGYDRDDDIQSLVESIGLDQTARLQASHKISNRSAGKLGKKNDIWRKRGIRA
jgi:hypothetical protein